MIREMLRLGADVTLRDENGETVLHHCCDWESDKIIKIYVDAGCDPTIKDIEDDHVALCVAAGDEDGNYINEVEPKWLYLK
jgi:ankyrin repeat protein